MARLLTLIAALLLIAPEAWGATCTSTGGSTWWGDVGSGGTVTWDCGTPTAVDDFIIDRAVTLGGSGAGEKHLGLPATQLSGDITIASGGSLEPSDDGGFVIYTTGSILFDAGSFPSGTVAFDGHEVATLAAPNAITFPDPRTVRLDYTELLGTAGTGEKSRFPFTICDPNGAAVTCGSDTVHPADDDAGEETSGTLVFFDYQKFGDTQKVRPIPKGGSVPDKPVYDPGLVLEVVAVNATNDTIDLALPTIPTSSTGAADASAGFNDHFNCAECLDDGLGAAGGGAGDQLRNDATGWRVQEVGTYTNEEGKQRYEIRIDEAVDAAPFNLDGEFNAFLACNESGSWCARVWRGFANNSWGGGDVNQETLVVMKDPIDIDTFDNGTNPTVYLYYAKPTFGDTLTFFNPVLLDFNGTAHTDTDNSFTVDVLSQITDLGNLHVREGHAASGVGFVGAGVRLENTQDSPNRDLDLFLIEHGGGPLADTVGAWSGASLQVIDTNDSGADAKGPSNVLIQRGNIRFPQSDRQVGRGIFGYAGLHFFDADFSASGDRWSSYTNTGLALGGAENALTGAAPNVAVGIRKLRIEGHTTGIGTASMGHVKNCVDGFFAQDVIVAHSRSGKEVYTGSGPTNNGEDQIETYGFASTCNLDRLAISSGNVGSPLLVRADRHDSPHYYTSVVQFGSSGVTQATFPNTVAANTGSNGMICTLDNNGTQDEAACSHDTWVVNYLTDSRFPPQQSAYGARVGWFTTNNSDGTEGVFPGVVNCEDTIGMFQIGGAGNINLNSVGDSGCGAPGDGTLKLYDNYIGNLGYGALDQDLDPFYLLFSVGGAPISPAPSLIDVDGLLVHQNSANSGTVRCFRMFSAEQGLLTSMDISLKNTTMICDINDQLYAARADLVNDMGTFSWDNVFLSGRNSLRTFQFDKGSGFLRYDGAAENATGDEVNGCDGDAGSGNDCPDGKVQFSGDLATGRGVRGVGYSLTPGTGDDPATALPRWSGPVAYTWPFSWATVDPVPVFQRTTPRNEFIPSWLKTDAGLGGGGGGGRGPRPY